SIPIDRTMTIEQLLLSDPEFFPGARERLGHFGPEKTIELQLGLLARKAGSNEQYKPYATLYLDYISLGRALTGGDFAAIRTEMLSTLFMETHYRIQEQRTAGKAASEVGFPTYAKIHERYRDRLTQESTRAQERALWERAARELGLTREARVREEKEKERRRTAP
ncbi:MAG: hypothetical protein ACD_62C00089G0006, partial [uncultured bacterium]